MTVELDAFGWQTLEHECVRLGVSEEQLISFALLYYLADVDSGRIARQMTGPAQRSEPLTSP